MAIDVFVFPSKFEGLGMVLIEAQASGLPIVTSDVVPKEAMITENIEAVSLENFPEYWANKVICMDKIQCNRENMCKILSDSSFNIKKEVKTLESIYFNE